MCATLAGLLCTSEKEMNGLCFRSYSWFPHALAVGVVQSEYDCMYAFHVFPCDSSWSTMFGRFTVTELSSGTPALVPAVDAM